ncbi:hypothetical protein [Streptomyces sp. NPDC004685]
MNTSPASRSVPVAPTTSGSGFPPRDAGWSGILDDGRRTARLEDVRAVFWRRPKHPHIADTIPEPYRTWARTRRMLPSRTSSLPCRVSRGSTTRTPIGLAAQEPQ